MKRYWKAALSAICVLTLLCTLAACAGDAGEKQYDWGITLAAENVTPTGLTLVCTQSGGNPTGELDTGSMFWLEGKDGSKWVSVQTVVKQDEIAWDSLAYLIPMAGESSWEVNWEYLYGTLSAGTYRIGKEVMDFRGPGDYDTQKYYAEFVIE